MNSTKKPYASTAIKQPIKPTWQHVLTYTVKQCRALVLLLLATTGLVACTSVNTAPEKTFYVLKNADSTPMAVSGTPRISIYRVKLPDYLNQQGIARQLPNGQVNLSYTDQWAEKLSQSIPTLLAENLSVQLQQPVETHPLPPGVSVDTVVEVHITRFIGTPEALQMRAGYRLVKRDRRLTSYVFETTIPLRDNRTMTLVDAYTTAIQRLSADIAIHLGKPLSTSTSALPSSLIMSE